MTLENYDDFIVQNRLSEPLSLASCNDIEFRKLSRFSYTEYSERAAESCKL